MKEGEEKKPNILMFGGLLGKKEEECCETPKRPFSLLGALSKGVNEAGSGVA